MRFQTGGTYATRGNCLSTPDLAVRKRTIALLKSFVDLAARWRSVIVFGSLQGRRSEEPDRDKGEARIREAIADEGQFASQQGAVLAFEPVCREEIGYHNTIAELAAVVAQLNLPGVRLMVDTFHMNIEERDMLAPLDGVRDILAHVHLSETNRDVLGVGHWPTAAFLSSVCGRLATRVIAAWACTTPATPRKYHRNVDGRDSRDVSMKAAGAEFDHLHEGFLAISEAKVPFQRLHCHDDIEIGINEHVPLVAITAPTGWCCRRIT